jgi:hypothetical protein
VNEGLTWRDRAFAIGERALVLGGLLLPVLWFRILWGGFGEREGLCWIVVGYLLGLTALISIIAGRGQRRVSRIVFSLLELVVWWFVALMLFF